MTLVVQLCARYQTHNTGRAINMAYRDGLIDFDQKEALLIEGKKIEANPTLYEALKRQVVGGNR